MTNKAKNSFDDENNNNTLQKQLSFGEDTLQKKTRQDNSNQNKNDVNNENEEMNMIISGEVIDVDLFKSGGSNRHLNLFNEKKYNEDIIIDNRNSQKNDLQESEDLKDSYCDTLLRNSNEYRINNSLNSTKKT